MVDLPQGDKRDCVTSNKSVVFIIVLQICLYLSINFIPIRNYNSMVVDTRVKKREYTRKT